MSRDPVTPQSQLDAAERYRKAAKRRRLTGSLVPIEIDKLLDEIAEDTGIESTTALIWHCVRETAKKKGRDRG